MVERRPLVAVVGSELFEGRGSVLGPDTSRRTRWWELTLECGHVVERTVSYDPNTRPAMKHARNKGDVLPAPKRARCYECSRT